MHLNKTEYKIIFKKYGALWQFWKLWFVFLIHCGKNKMNRINISFNLFSFQIVKLMKPIVAASSHVLGNKNVDEGEDVFDDSQFFSVAFLFSTNWTESRKSSFKASVLCFVYF